jgi:hypothetical protein
MFILHTLIHRFIEPEENSALLDILWSDPISEDNVDSMSGGQLLPPPSPPPSLPSSLPHPVCTLTDSEYAEFIAADWRPNPTRGTTH